LEIAIEVNAIAAAVRETALALALSLLTRRPIAAIFRLLALLADLLAGQRHARQDSSAQSRTAGG
jgi:hypothetical protein